MGHWSVLICTQCMSQLALANVGALRVGDGACFGCRSWATAIPWRMSSGLLTMKRCLCRTPSTCLSRHSPHPPHPCAVAESITSEEDIINTIPIFFP